EQLPLSKSTGTQLGSAGQSLAQPVSPGPWGPQDEEFEQEAWTSILGYAPGRDQEPRGAEGDHKTTATGPPPVAQPPPPKAHAATNLGTPTRGVLRGLSPLAAGAARAVPATTPVPAKLGDGTDYQKAAPKDSEHEARQMHNNTELIETTRDNHNNPDDYLHAQGLVFATQPPPTLLVPPGGPMPPHRGLHPNHDAFEDAYPTDVDAAEEPDWSRDSQDETDEEKDDDTTNLDKPGPSHGTRGSERPAEPVGAPPARPGSREDLTAEETRMERNRRARAEWREWRRQQRRRGLAPGYFYPSGAERSVQMSSMLVLDLPQDALLPDIFPDDAEQPGFRQLRVADFRAFMSALTASEDFLRFLQVMYAAAAGALRQTMPLAQIDDPCIRLAMSDTMSVFVVFTSLLLVSSDRSILTRRGLAEKESRSLFLEAGDASESLRCEEELRRLKSGIQESCEEDQRNGATVSAGGCHAEAEAVVNDGDYEVWSQSLLTCGSEKTHLLLWSGYQDEEREDVLRPLREKGGCVLQSQADPDTRLGQLLNAPGVNTLKSCSLPKVKAFWVGASRQFASTWAARSQEVIVAINYHKQQGRSYKVLFDTVFYRGELKAAVQAFRDGLQMRILYTHPGMTEGDMIAATSVMYERARLLSPVPAEKFRETTTWRFGHCAKENLAQAVSQSQALLDPDDPLFLNNLGVMYFDGLGVARDLHEARGLFERSMAKGNPRAFTSLGIMYQQGRGVFQDYDKARDLYQRGYARGDDLAAAMLATMYRDGLGLARDSQNAKLLYQLAIDRGDTAAANWLGNMYQYGQGVAQDLQKAKELYELGNAGGDMYCADSLGFMYLNGDGVTQDFVKAKEFFETAISRGSAEAASHLGHMYEDGLGVDQDFRKAKDAYERAVEMGSTRAALELGNMYQYGRGLTQDFRKAKELYELGIARGDMLCPESLGHLYRDGLGVPQDYSKAKELYEKGLARGSHGAALSLACMYKYGLGVFRDSAKAREFYEKGSGSSSNYSTANLAPPVCPSTI
ncbi:esiB, partial [Symbiodinium microadriaticum]